MTDDTPTDRAALEALAKMAENIAHGKGHVAGWYFDVAATLRALAARAEPPAEEGAKSRMEQSDNVAALVEEASVWQAAPDDANSYLSPFLDDDITPSSSCDLSHLASEAVAYADNTDAARGWTGTSTLLLRRLAAALTAQAERVQEPEGRHADGARELSRALQEKDRLVMQSTARAEKAEALLGRLIAWDNGEGDEPGIALRAICDDARALAAKLKGEG